MELDVRAAAKRALESNETRLMVARELWKRTPFYGEVDEAVFGNTEVVPDIQDKKDGWVEVSKKESLCTGHYIELKQRFTYDDVVRYCSFILNEKEIVSRSIRQISYYLDNLKCVVENERIKALARMAEEALSVVGRYLKSNLKEN